MKTFLKIASVMAFVISVSSADMVKTTVSYEEIAQTKVNFSVETTSVDKKLVDQSVKVAGLLYRGYW